MLSFLPSFILMPISFILFCSNLAVIGTFICLGGLLKLLIPVKSWHKALYRPMHAIYRLWALNNFLLMSLFNKIDWQISGTENLSKDKWYLLIANHQSWLDIFVLSHISRKHTAEPKYFLKESLKKVPFIGMGCWALEMPFMKRHSKAFIEKYPHLKGQDIEATRKSCQAFSEHPTTIINFVEGTRFTDEKHSKKPIFKHLLPPKAGGIAFTLASLGNKFDKVLNVTILYPNTSNHIMKDLLKGKLTTIIIKIEQIDIDNKIIGDYFNDDSFKEKFQLWLNKLWKSKDIEINRILNK